MTNTTPIFLIDCHTIAWGKKKEEPHKNVLKECIREIAIMNLETKTIVLHEHVVPCISYRNLRPTYRESFGFCKRKVHGLHFYPDPPPIHNYLHCHDIVFKIKSMFPPNAVFLYKGGTLEHDLLLETGHHSININDWKVPKIHQILEKFPVINHRCCKHASGIEVSCPIQKLCLYRTYILACCRNFISCL